MSEGAYTIFLDENWHFPIHLWVEEERVRVLVDVTRATRQRFIHNLEKGLWLRGQGEATGFIFDAKEKALNASIHAGEAELQLNDTLLLRVSPAGLERVTALTVFETRMLGQHVLSEHLRSQVPYPRQEVAKLVPDYHYPITDLHTHITSQISGDALLKAAVAVDALYPAELLHILGIPTDPYETQPMMSVPFIATQGEGLRCEQVGREIQAVRIQDVMARESDYQRLLASLSIPVDNVYTFDQLERSVYRMRNPLAKNPDIVPEMIQQIAKGYEAQHIQYAELSATGALNPKWLVSAIPALEKAEASTGVQLRLLAAIPRTLSPDQMLKQLDAARYASRCPHVVGVDFVGYEANKTRNFRWALDNLALWVRKQRQGAMDPEWRWEFADDFIIRVHAGENGKNPNNVREVLQVAERYGVRVRVGHAAYGDFQRMKGLAKRLSEQGLLAVEFNPDSNMALNNIDGATLPIKLWLESGVDCLLASDGAGAYQTTDAQLAKAAVFTGLKVEHLQQMREAEEAYIARQSKLFTRKKASFDKTYPQFTDFIEDFSAYIEKLDMHQALVGKIPVLIAGASGTSWEVIEERDRREVEIAMEMLVSALDPRKVYFALGRVKDAGVGTAVDRAVGRYNREFLHKVPFQVMGMLSGQQNTPALADSLSHIYMMEGGLMEVPREMTSFIKQHKGYALYIGGGTFTRDFIKLSDDMGLAFGVMRGPAGAANDKATFLGRQHVFEGARGLVRHLYQLHQAKGEEGIFNQDWQVDQDEGLWALYQHAKAKIESW